MNRTLKKRELSKRGTKSSAYRRIVTGNVNGKAVVQSDEQLLAYQFKTVRGYEHTRTSSLEDSRPRRFCGK